MLTNESLPPVVGISKSHVSDDLYICALGFEERCPTATRRLGQIGYKAKHAIFLTYDTNPEDNKLNEESLKELLNSISLSVPQVSEYRLSEPNISLRNFMSTLRGMASLIESVTVDISSFSSGAILQILDALLRHPSIKSIRILYTEAAEYFPKKEDDIVKDHLSVGVKDVFSLPNFGGLHSAGYSQVLITFLGFSAIRAKGVYNWYQPTRKIGIIGKPPREDRGWRVDLTRRIHERHYHTNDQLIVLSTFDYAQVLQRLEELYLELSAEHNIGVSPLGSKMQTLGLLFFLLNHSDVQIIISVPEKFDAKRYSESSGPTWEVNLDCINIRERLGIRRLAPI